MNASQKLIRYQQQFALRLRRLWLWRGIAATTLIWLVVSMIGSYVALRSGFDGGVFVLARFALVAAMAAAVLFLLYLPLKKLSDQKLPGKKLSSQITAKLEQRHGAFAGRIETFAQAQEQNNPMLELLASDTLELANQAPIERLIERRELQIPMLTAAAAALIFLTVLAVGPGLMNYSLRYLLAGWAFEQLLPPQTIAVTPGDTLVRRGGNVQVNASAVGFISEDLDIFVKMGDQGWQQVDMSKTPVFIQDRGDSDDNPGNKSGYDFTFFSVRSPIEYYVSTDNVRSPSYQIEVVELPGVRNIQMTYDYPDWTGLEDEIITQAGDIAALPGTRVLIEVLTDSPLPAAELVLDGVAQPLTIEGEMARAEFSVEQDGQYFLAANIGGEQVRLIDDYFIRTLADQKPEIGFSFPGRDWKASNIEEVLTEVSVKDDFGVTNVELHYAINGGDWQLLELDAGPSVRQQSSLIEHQFFLEDIQVETQIFDLPLPTSPNSSTEPDPSGALNSDETELLSLVPGDLIAYYALVEDREQTEQTDMYFIEVQPFDRRFSQAEQGGGGMAGGQGEQQMEISQRQREIIVSTWNLIREKNDPSQDPSALEQRLRDNTKLLSQLQASLAVQAESLVETVRSRQMTEDERVETYVRHIDNAIDAMYPASQELADLSLDTAIQPEQEALQHLLRADAVFADMQVSNNRGSGGGAGGGAGADLAEMFELEMDMERNQYETGSRASLQEQAEQADEAMDQLADLARRQQQLANNMGNRGGTPTEAEKWQQQMLRREAEQLQQQLTQPSPDQQNGQQPSGQQSGQQAGTGAGGEPSPPQTAELNRRLQSAMEAMDRAAEAIQSGDMQQLQQAAGEAQRQLEGAGNQIATDQKQSQQQALAAMVAQAQGLYDDQLTIENRLLDAVSEAMASVDPVTDDFDYPFSRDEEEQMSIEKRDMIARLQRLQEQVRISAEQLRTDAPSVARLLSNADAEVKESEIAIRMDMAAGYMSNGQSLYIANSESLVTNGLRDLKDSTEQALRMLSGGADETTNLDRMLENLRAGRNGIADMTQSDQQAVESEAAGADSENVQQPDSQAAQTQQAQSAQNPGQASAEGQNPAAEGSESTEPRGQQGTGWGNWSGVRGISPDLNEQVADQLNRALTGVGNLVPEMRARGVDESAIADIQNLVRELQNRNLRSYDIDSVVELNDTLSLLEELEQSVEKGLTDNDGLVRTDSPEIVPAEFRDAVADYYRRLSDDSAKSDTR